MFVRVTSEFKKKISMYIKLLTSDCIIYFLPPIRDHKNKTALITSTYYCKGLNAIPINLFKLAFNLIVVLEQSGS